MTEFGGDEILQYQWSQYIYIYIYIYIVSADR
jgi:hypothetical protein